MVKTGFQSSTVRRSQQGFTALVLLLVLGAVVGTSLFTYFKLFTSTVQTDKTTANALARARDALIGYAASHPTLPGGLPCPDTNNDGFSDVVGQNCAAYIGRLPWAQLGIPDLRDGNDECLWYALSPVFRDALPATSRTAGSNPLNSAIAGQLTVYDRNGSMVAGPNPVIAIVIAPGGPLALQNRTPAGASACGGNTVAAAYLDTIAGLNNATGGGINAFVEGPSSTSFNDKLLLLTGPQLFASVGHRVAAEIRSSLKTYYLNKSKYPWSADSTSNGSQVSNSTTGPVPYNDSDYNFSDGIQQTWLTNNNWFSVATYRVSSNFSPSSSYPQQCGVGGVGCLTVNNYVNSQAAVTVGSVSSIVCSTNALVTNCP